MVLEGLLQIGAKNFTVVNVFLGSQGMRENMVMNMWHIEEHQHTS